MSDCSAHAMRVRRTNQEVLQFFLEVLVLQNAISLRRPAVLMLMHLTSWVSHFQNGVLD